MLLSSCAPIAIHLATIAQFEHAFKENGKLSLFLCDTNGEENVFLNDELLKAGFAEPSFQQPIQELQAHLVQAIAKPENYAAILQSVQASGQLQMAGQPLLEPAVQEHSPEVAQPAEDSDVFNDDLFDEFYQKVMSVMQRFVKRAVTVDNFQFHVIDVNGELYISCADLAALFWNNKDEDYLLLRLRVKRYDLPKFKIFYNGNPDMFYQIKKFQVKGVKGFDEDAELLVCPLKKVIEVLNLIGHPSVHVREMVRFEMENFSHSNPVWMEFHEDVPDLQEINPISFSEEDKLKRLCLIDLLTMKERLVAKLSRNANCLEVARMRDLIFKIGERIPEVMRICQTSCSRT